MSATLEVKCESCGRYVSFNMEISRYGDFILEASPCECQAGKIAELEDRVAELEDIVTELQEARDED